MTTIQAAGLGDAQAILALQRLAYESEARLYDDWSIPPLMQTLESLVAEFQTHTILKAVLDDRLVGSVRYALVDDRVIIGRLIVAPPVQGRGIGSALLRAVEAQAQGAGVRTLSLFTGSRSEANIRLYRRHGYGIVRTEVMSPAVSLVFMEKPCASR